jgi:hypothetical protein
MKLQTSIPARRDGTVRVLGQDRQTYVFAAGPDGELIGDVTDEATIAFLLAGGLFWPANPEDFDAALSLAKQAEPVEDDDEDGMDALPVEAETPPAPKRARKAKAE